MSVGNFKIGFTIAGETLLALMSKMLPIENLSVEWSLAPASKTPARRSDNRAQPEEIPAAQEASEQARFARPEPSTRGINAIIVTQLTDGPKTASEMQPKIKEAGFLRILRALALRRCRTTGLSSALETGDGGSRKPHE